MSKQMTVPTTFRVAFENIMARHVSKNAMRNGLAANVLQALESKQVYSKVSEWNAHLSFKTAKKLQEQGILA